jgi:tetratricopeptide (TPR) repeat protein
MNFNGLIKSYELANASGKIEESLCILIQALKMQPNNISLLNKIAEINLNLKNYEESLLYLKKASLIDESNPIIHRNLGLILIKIKDYNSAKYHLNKSLVLDDNNCLTYLDLIEAFDHLGDHRGILETCLNAMTRWPNIIEFHINMGSALSGLNLYDEALISLETALILSPDNIDAVMNIANIYLLKGERDAVIPMYEKIISEPNYYKHPKINMIKYYLGVEYLRVGKLNDGWNLYDYGFDDCIPAYIKRQPDRVFKVPIWNGEDLTNKKLLVWAEQGIGDEIMFSPLISDLCKKFDNIIFECEPRLVEIFSRSLNNIKVRSSSYDLSNKKMQIYDDFDYHIPLASLGKYFKINKNTLINYDFRLKIDDRKYYKFKERLNKFNNKIKIGICWRSGLLTSIRNIQYLQLKDWEPVFNLKNCVFINLQYGDCESEIVEAEDFFGIEIIRWSDIDLKLDIDDVFSLTKCLDFVITAPTSVSVIAGAIDINAYTYQTYRSFDYLGSLIHPWFPSINMFISKNGENVAEILQNICEDIKIKYPQLN